MKKHVNKIMIADYDGTYMVMISTVYVTMHQKQKQMIQTFANIIIRWSVPADKCKQLSSSRQDQNNETFGFI